MLSRKHRFRGYGSLKRVYRSGRTVRGPLFAVKVAPNPRRSEYRAAVVVSRKVNKSAVARNRIRRRLYEIIRETGVDISAPHDVVVVVFHDSVLEEPHKSLLRQMRKQLRQAGVI